MERTFRACVALFALTILVACGDGRGSQYSSARGQASAPPPTYIPVTPGATPVAVEPALTTVPAQAAVPAPVPAAPLQQPIAVTPGATPIVFVDAATPNAPAASLKPVPRGQRPAVAVAQVSAPVRTVTKPTPAPTRVSATAPVVAQRVSRGPIYSACRAAGRKSASGGRCGCIQWVANRELTAAQQKRGAGYFKNPQGLQDARQSDNAASNAFWRTWKAYGEKANEMCRKT